jgi:hypothetical protein
MKPLTLKHCLALTILALGLMFAVAFLCDNTYGPLKLHYVFEIVGSFFLGVTLSKLKIPNFFGLAYSMLPACISINFQKPFWVGLILVGYPFLLGLCVKDEERVFQ